MAPSNHESGEEKVGEATDLPSLAVKLESNFMGRLPSILCDTRLVWSGSVSLYPVLLNLTVNLTAKLVTFLQQLHHKTDYLGIMRIGMTWFLFSSSLEKKKNRNRKYREGQTSSHLLQKNKTNIDSQRLHVAAVIAQFL